MCDFWNSIASVESSASPRGEKDSVYVCGRFFYKKQRGEANSVIYGIIRFNYNSNCYNLEHRSSSLAIRISLTVRSLTYASERLANELFSQAIKYHKNLNYYVFS